jgi:hypothetical protein
MRDEFLFTCDECGTGFDPDPLAILECGWGRACAGEDKCEEAVSEKEGITEEALASMSEYELGEIGMTAKQRDQLLSGTEIIDTGTICLCLACRRSIFGKSESLRP